MASVRGSCGAFPRLASSQCGPLQAGSRATAAVVPVGWSAGPNGSEQLPLHRVSSRRICPPGYLTGLQGQRRFFGVSGSYGYGAFYRGEADLEAQSNVRLQRLDTEEIPKKGSMTLKMPETVAVLAAEGALRRCVTPQSCSQKKES